MSDECIFCHHDPYHYVDIGVGFQAAAVNCCELGIALYQHGDEELSRVADRIEELEKACKEWADISQSNYQRAKAAEAKLEVAMVAFTDLEQDCEADYPPSYGAMKYYIQRALAELKGEQP